MNTDCYTFAQPWGWREKLRAKVFPFTICHTPEAPAQFQDVLISKVRSELSFLDRIRVLFTGRVEVEVRTVTENLIGGTATNSVVRCGRFYH
jgi:hypothetical protein